MKENEKIRQNVTKPLRAHKDHPTFIEKPNLNVTAYPSQVQKCRFEFFK